MEEKGLTRSEPDGAEIDWRVLREWSRLLLVHFWHAGRQGFGREVLRFFLALDTRSFHRDRRVFFYRMSTELREPTDLERKGICGSLR